MGYKKTGNSDAKYYCAPFVPLDTKPPGLVMCVVIEIAAFIIMMSLMIMGSVLFPKTAADWRRDRRADEHRIRNARKLGRLH